MKRIYILSGLLVLFNFSFAQVTNTFPGNGSVGIGTINPSSVLVPGTNLTINANGGYSSLILQNSGTDRGFFTATASQAILGTVTANTNLQFNTNGLGRMLIDPNGNVGIGTTNPLANLHIIGAIRWGGEDTNFLYTGQDGIGAYFEQVGTDADKSKMRFQTSKNGSGSGYAQFVIDPEKGFSFVNLGSASSNVGIGTTDTKGYKLAVAGSVIAESVKVQLQGTWPDYVFTKNYQLPTLQQTEQHIKEKGHLPGIPTAAEVKANGIDLGEMNAKFLQKIEELTLHLIEKEKQINILIEMGKSAATDDPNNNNKLLNELKKRIEILEKKQHEK